MPELLLELLSEEIPARMQGRAADDLRRLVTEALAAAELPPGGSKVLYGPRRLALMVSGLPAAQPDRREERRGPRADAPDKAVEGFLRANGIDRAACEERETPKGVFLFAVIDRPGRPTREVLSDLLPEVIHKLPWPKSMRWADLPERWVRPLHGILCLFDGAVVPLRFAGVDSGAETRGHRFHAPAAFPVRDAADYLVKLQAAKVMADAKERRAAILTAAERIAARDRLRLVPDEALLDELTGLVEWPVVLAGRFDERFMAVPPEVLVTSMRAHQKYIALRDAEGRLAPRFLVVANLEAEDGGRAIVAGNQRVLRARLADAEFFWETDRKRPLAERVPALDGIVFHARLGSLGDKVRRVERLAGALAQALPGADDTLCRRAARLAKADLVSEMVGEFPELQGVMGRYYALHDGEDEAVAQAIAEHYAPQGPGDACPRAPVAVTVALADKIDTLVGFFGVGETPTGSRDPFALRRAALGVIRLVLENGLRLPLLAAFAAAGEGYRDTGGWTSPDAALLDFFADRLKVHLRERDLRHDLIAAVFAVRRDGRPEDDLARLVAKVEALARFLATEAGGNLLVAYRRAANIVRIEQASKERPWRDDGGGVDPARFADAREAAVHETLAAIGREAADPTDAAGFERYLAGLARLREPVDAFFDRVTVNAPDPALRDNRLKLLEDIRRTMDQVADFSLIEG